MVKHTLTYTYGEAQLHGGVNGSIAVQVDLQRDYGVLTESYLMKVMP